MTTRRPVYDANHPVALAVEPLRYAAMDRAQKYAEQMIAEALAKLDAADGDAGKAAPYPRSVMGMSRSDYAEAKRAYDFLRRIARCVGSSCRRMNDPEPRAANPEAIEQFKTAAAEAASFQYDAFICKMVEKIGPCVSAGLSGSHVWGHSLLTVTKGDGSREVWKTQQIVNVSKLGLPYNQWPSRRMVR